MVGSLQHTGMAHSIGDFSSSSRVRSSRGLQQNLLCPVGCLDSACVQDSTNSRLRCLKCQNSLVVDRITGLCGCPAGRYSPNGAFACQDCPKGSWCAGGVLTPNSSPNITLCPVGMTTVGMRSGTSRSCVNLPGFSYTVDAMGFPGVFQCPVNTYNPGMRRQRTCWPCPAGYTTNGLTGCTDVSQCVVPPGSYMRFPTIVALCPEGQWKNWVGADDYCNACPDGTTTTTQGSTSLQNCTYLQPGFYAAAMTGALITQAKPCPQKFYCPGGKPLGAFDTSNPAARNLSDLTLWACPNGMWTQTPGATSLAQCMTPPGFFTANGTTSKCPAGSYRAGWTSGADGSSCMSCGTSVFSADDTQIDEYSMTDAAVKTARGVTTTADSCYIKPGQGIYFVGSLSTWRARNCVSDSYGVNVTKYGLNPANCRPCPLNMVTSTNATTYPRSASYFVDNGDNRSFGFISKWACVNRAGYGFNGRWSLPCPLGTYNTQDNWDNCTSCGIGLTTAAPGAGVTFADCGVAAGYGYHNDTLMLCPLGYYNDAAINYTLTTPCTACPTGATTGTPGASNASDCNLCRPGYGGLGCATVCGGIEANGTYGQGLRPLSTPCAACTTTNLTVDLGGPTVLAAPPSSRAWASTQSDCLSLWANYGGGWYLTDGTAAASDIVSNVTSLSDCLQLCAAASDCQVSTYFQVTKDCQLRKGRPPQFRGAPVIAFKAVTAGNASQPSGAYVYYQDPYALDLGWQSAPAGAGSFTSMQQCEDACDQDADCAGVTIRMLLDEASRPTTCLMIKGPNDALQEARSFVKADATRLAYPELL